MPESHDDLLIQLSTRISIAVHMVGVLADADEATIEHAKDITHGELVSLLRGEGKYGEALQGLADGTVSEGHVLVLVTKTCVRKIAEYREVESLREFATFREAVSQ